MRRAIVCAAFAVLNLLVLGLPAAGETPAPIAWDAKALWDAWPSARVSPADPWTLKHAGLREALGALEKRAPGLFRVEQEGVSSEGRKIPLVALGNGPVSVLLWSQMHGDEPMATSALLDVLSWLGSNRGDPAVRRLLSALTVRIIPMLNPDGAERTQRRNAQEIDINRDALHLATPEGRFLESVRDRYAPMIGFNLHNQGPLVAAGRPGNQAAISLLSVPFDDALSESEGTRRTKRLAVKVAGLVASIAPGRVGRYDMDYTARAFGDSMTRWGTPILLIETGGWAGPGEAERLVRLNFVALLGALAAIADGSLESVDATGYGKIPLNARDQLFSLVVRNASLAGGRGLPPFPADLSFVVPGAFAGEAPRRREPAVTEVGDLGHARGLAELDATGLLAVPWPASELREDWAGLRSELERRGLAPSVEEAKLLSAVRSLGEAAVARPGFAGALLFYRQVSPGVVRLEGAVLRGRVVGDGLALPPSTAHEN
jgi:Zinc carboxypeptidase